MCCLSISRWRILLDWPRFIFLNKNLFFLNQSKSRVFSIPNSVNILMYKVVSLEFPSCMPIPIKLLMEDSTNVFTTPEFDDPYHGKDLERSAEDTKIQSSSASFKKRNVISSRGGSHSRSGKRNCTQSQLSHSFYEDIREKLKGLEMPLWNASATTWLRDSSPKHKIPMAQRFSTLEQDKRKNSQFLDLRVHNNLLDVKRGRTFERATRQNHFLDKNKTDNPSPANYNTPRFLGNSFYKCRKITSISPQLRSKSELKMHEGSSVYSGSLIENPESRGSPHYQNSKHFLKEDEESRFDELRGRTFYKTRNHHKIYLQHGQQFAYNEHFTKGVPGVGKYKVAEPIGKEKASYSMRKVLNRFNEKIKVSPGPSSYINNPIHPKPSTQKNTITASNRLNLSKPLNTTPGPAFYAITRYLQNKKAL